MTLGSKSSGILMRVMSYEICTSVVEKDAFHGFLSCVDVFWFLNFSYSLFYVFVSWTKYWWDMWSIYSVFSGGVFGGRRRGREGRRG